MPPCTLRGDARSSSVSAAAEGRRVSGSAAAPDCNGCDGGDTLADAAKGCDCWVPKEEDVGRRGEGADDDDCNWAASAWEGAGVGFKLAV